MITGPKHMYTSAAVLIESAVSMPGHKVALWALCFSIMSQHVSLGMKTARSKTMAGNEVRLLQRVEVGDQHKQHSAPPLLLFMSRNATDWPQLSVVRTPFHTDAGRFHNPPPWDHEPKSFGFIENGCCGRLHEQLNAAE